MKTTRIVLTEPFIRHPAGLVFELDEATGISGWDDDERVREKQSFSGKRTYHLPDGGNGGEYELPVSATAFCPPEVFEQEDLLSGPCRLTWAGFPGAQNDVWNAGYKLVEINGLNAQGFEFPQDIFETEPVAMSLYDRLRNESIGDLSVRHLVDCSKLLPGFYELRLTFRHGEPYMIRFIKSFPLLVNILDRSGRYNTQKTLY